MRRDPDDAVGHAGRVSPHRRAVFDMLFACASETLLALGRDPKRLGANLGVTMVLHTWTRELLFHPHVHGIVTGGGLSADGARSALAGNSSSRCA